MMKVFVDDRVLNPIGWNQRMQLAGQAEDATARRNLEDAIGIVRGFILLAFAVVIGRTIVVGGRMLFEYVVNTMGR